MPMMFKETLIWTVEVLISQGLQDTLPIIHTHFDGTVPASGAEALPLVKQGMS